MARCVCIVGGCSNSSYKDTELKFYMLPRIPAHRYGRWLKRIGRPDLKDLPHQRRYICEAHFPPKIVNQPRKYLRQIILRPTLNLPHFPVKDAKRARRPKEVAIKTEPTEEEESEMEIHGELRISTGPVSSSKNVKRPKKHPSNAQKFFALCDEFLDVDVAELIKSQVDLKSNVLKKKETDGYKMFFVYLYHTNPTSYLALQKTLGLPSVANIRALYKLSLNKGFTNLMAVLKAKIDCMTDLDKNCSVLIKLIDLKPHLFYNISQEKLVGFSSTDSKRVARYGLIVMARGLLSRWALPVHYALFHSKIDAQRQAMSEWIHQVISELFNIGLKVRVCLSNLRSSSITTARPPRVTVQMPFFHVGQNRIYYAYDPIFLMKSVYESFKCLINSEFHFSGVVAKWQDILQFYENDSQKAHRLAPKLSEKHVMATGDTIEGCIATETLNERVAAAIANYIDFGVMDKSAMGTVKLLTLMGRLYKFLTSTNARNSCEFRKPLDGNKFQMKLVMESLATLRGLKIIENCVNIVSDVKFVKQLQISIRAIMLLFEDLKQAGISSLCTENIQLNILENFEQKLIEKSKTKDITAWRLMSAQRRMLITNVIKTSKNQSCPTQVPDIIQEYLLSKPEVNEQSLIQYSKISTIPLRISISDYIDFKMPAKNQIFSICEFILKKCYLRHRSCLLSEKKGHQSYEKYKEVFGESHFLAQPDPRVVPSDSLIEFVELLDQHLEKVIFENFYKTQAMCLLQQPSWSNFHPPCICFPINFMIKLFYRLRISYQLKLNNRRFSKSSSEQILFRFIKMK